MKKNKIVLILVIFIVIALTIFGGVTYAWLTSNNSHQINIKLGEFEASIVATINDEQVTTDPTYEELFRLNGATKELVVEKEDTNKNYLEDLSVNIELRNDIPAYLRVKISDEWVVKRIIGSTEYEEIIAHENGKANVSGNVEGNEDLKRIADAICPFNLDTKWFFDEKTGYIYYQDLLDKNLDNMTIPLILNKGYTYNIRSNDIYSETCEVTLNIKVEMVQANRIEAFWGIDTIPTA